MNTHPVDTIQTKTERLSITSLSSSDTPLMSANNKVGDMSELRAQIIANATVAFPGPVGSLSRAKEKGEVDCDKKPFDIVVRRNGQQIQAYIASGETTYNVLVVPMSATTMEGALMKLLLDVGNLATKRITTGGGKVFLPDSQRFLMDMALGVGGKCVNREYLE